jgi:hypothetical protein
MSETSHVEGNPVTAAAASSAGDAPTGAATVGTDAQYAPPSAIGLFRPLRNISEVRHFFRTNEVRSISSARPFNLLGLDR